MNIHEATDIVFSYINTVVDNTKNLECVVRKSLCEYCKREIVDAFKVYTAHYAIFSYIPPDASDKFFLMINRLNILQDEKVYNKYIQLEKRQKGGLFVKPLNDKEYSDLFDFRQSTFMCDEHDEVVTSFNKVLEYWSKYMDSDGDIVDNEPYEHIYKNILSIKYIPEYSEMFLKEGLRRFKLRERK